MGKKWRKKFKFDCGDHAANRDMKILSAYYNGKRTPTACVREWNKNYSSTLTVEEFEEMAWDLGYGRE